MAKINYNTALSNLVAALIGASGETLATGERIRYALASEGANYDTRYTSEVEDAATAWEGAKLSAWTSADADARAATVAAGGAPLAALPFDSGSPPYALVSRLDAARAGLHAEPLRAQLVARREALEAVYAHPPSALQAKTKLVQERVGNPRISASIMAQATAMPPPSVYVMKLLALEARVTSAELEKALAWRERWITIAPSIADLEKSLLARIADAAEWIAFEGAS